MKKIISLLLMLTICFPNVVSVSATGEKEESKIKNIIYMIPDGGGMEPFYLSDALKQAGGFDRNVYPNSTEIQTREMRAKQYLVGAVTTRSANADITDSAAAGTALSSGYKTNNNHVGMTAKEIPKANILEAAQYVGMKTGMVTTYEWTNATPAAFSAHEKDRGNYTPMSEQIVNQNIDVVLGVGFGAAKWGDISEAEIRGYDIINTREELEAVKPGDRIWGNLVDSAFPYDIAYDENTPNLAEMTKAAITALDNGSEEGFFLMVEGSKVDGAGHGNDAVGMMSEFIAFDEACGVALEYAKNREDTVVVILADHDTGGMILPDNLENAVKNIQNGKKPTDIAWESTNHTARNVGLFMYIPEGAEYPEGISGKDIGTHAAYENNVIDNTVIAPYLAEMINVDLDDVSNKLFVDVTDQGTYDKDMGVFVFNDYDINVIPNTSYAYVNGKVADLDGQVMVMAKNRFYVPQLLLDIAENKVEYEINEYIAPINSDMHVYISDTTNIDKWNAQITVKTFLSGDGFSGKIKFTAPKEFTAIDEIDIQVDSLSSKSYEIECPNFDWRQKGLVFEYDIISDDGSVYHIKSSEFKGLAYGELTDDEIKIDGVIDEAAWKNGYVMTCDDASQIVNIEGWKGDRDLSGDFSVLWDDEYLYMYAVVRDEDFMTDYEVSTLWLGDSVLLGFFDDTEKQLINGTAGAKFEEIGLAYMDGVPRAFRYISQNGLTKIGEIHQSENFDMKCVKGIETLTYELKFKWSELFGYDYVPQTGSVLGFSALINDNDGNGRRGWIEYASGIGSAKNANEFVYMPLLDLAESK